MEGLNVFFGVIGVLSLGYAIWENRRARTAKTLTRSLTGDVQQIARLIYGYNQGTPTEGYARSIIQICNTLLGGRAAGPDIGDVEVSYPAWQSPPMQTNSGEIVDDPRALYGRAVKGRHLSDFRNTLVYGPHARLPVSGRYRVDYYLRAEFDETDPEAGKPAVRLDVYDYGRRERLGEQILTAVDLADDYERSSLEFLYEDLTRTIEYRVKIVSPAVTVWCETIIVRRISD